MAMYHLWLVSGIFLLSRNVLSKMLCLSSSMKLGPEHIYQNIVINTSCPSPTNLTRLYFCHAKVQILQELVNIQLEHLLNCLLHSNGTTSNFWQYLYMIRTKLIFFLSWQFIYPSLIERTRGCKSWIFKIQIRVYNSFKSVWNQFE